MKVPVGYYVLAIAVRPDSPYPQTPVIDRWSVQALTMLEAGQSITWEEYVVKTTKVFTIHSWGFCRLQKAKIGLREFQPYNGALFIDVDYVAEAGFRLSVTVEALSPEGLVG